MTIAAKQLAKRSAYDSNDLHLLDVDDRRHDPDGIDWDEIIASTQDDIEAGIYAYDSGNYPTEEIAMAALKQLIHKAAEEGRREAATAYSSHTPSR